MRITRKRGGVCPCMLGSQQGGSTNRPSVDYTLKEIEDIMNRYECGLYSQTDAYLCATKIINMINNKETDPNEFIRITNDYNRLVRLLNQLSYNMRGGGCGCSKAPLTNLYGGYRATRKDKNLYKKFKKGKSIGFTGRSSLKAKGILPRSNGRYILGPKYSGTGKPRVLKKPTKTRKAKK